MKKNKFVLAGWLLANTALCISALGQLAIPSDGSDGALNITSNTVIDLSLAVSGVWSNNNTANVGKGIYDSNKWAVVFKYSSVNIGSGATVTFKNHPTHAPVVWLVTNTVAINGTLSLDSQSGGNILYDNVNLVEPGPGGFRGGARPQQNLGTGAGFGPGGHNEGDNFNGAYYYGQAAYTTGPLAYGNPQVVPLIGGSGGAAHAGGGFNGGAGGGALLIAASGNITVSATGKISADGIYPGNGYGGSGGAIRLIADQVLGSGRIEALGSEAGRIRVEANLASTSMDLNPTTAAVPPLPLVIWPDPNASTVRIISVSGQNAPGDPKASMLLGAVDLILATNSVSIMLQTAHFPTNGTVNVFIKPRNSGQSILPAAFVSGDFNSALWQVTTSLLPSHTIIQARAVAN